MPQALRIIIPPTTNQYLNLTKNSSLAAAIAYPDLVLVFAGTALMQTGKAIEIVSITMFTYLSLSISISLFMNWYNKKIAITGKIMSKINFLKPDKSNLYTFLYLGSFLFFISVLDVLLNSFFSLNITGFLPGFLSFLLPLILGFIGLYFIRIELSGIKQLDLLNKHINTNNFNAILSLINYIYNFKINSTYIKLVFY